MGFKFLINLDEACWSGDNDLQSILRNRTGNDTVTIEEKFGAKFEIRDYARFVITANTPDAVRLQVSNRRYLIFENSENYRDHAIYEKLWNGIKHGDLCERYYNYLMDFDISNFKPHKFPDHLDDQGTDTKIGQDVFRMYLFDLFVEDPRPLFVKNKGIGNKEMYESFMEYLHAVKSWKKNCSEREFWQAMRKLAPVIKGKEFKPRIDGEQVPVFAVSPKEFKDSFWRTLRLPKKYADINETEYYLKGVK